MADTCIGPSGVDVCHLARGTPVVNFDQLPELRKKHRQTHPIAREVQKEVSTVSKPSGRGVAKPALAKAEVDEKQDKLAQLRDDFGTPRLGVPPMTRLSGTIASRATNPIKATITSLPTKAKLYAELVKVSTLYDKDGLEAAKARMKTTAPEYSIDTRLSTVDYIVATSAKTGKSVVAFRGTNPMGKNQERAAQGISRARHVARHPRRPGAPL